jgi:hypothetical protein
LLLRTGGRTASVEVPVPEAERDDVRQPDHRSGRQQPVGVVCEGCVFREDVVYEADRGNEVRDSERRDDHGDADPKPRSLAVDAPGVCDDQSGDENDEHRRKDPRRLDPVAGR